MTNSIVMWVLMSFQVNLPPSVISYHKAQGDCIELKNKIKNKTNAKLECVQSHFVIEKGNARENKLKGIV